MESERAKFRRRYTGLTRIFVASLCSSLLLILFFSSLSEATEPKYCVRISPSSQLCPQENQAQQGSNLIANASFEESAPARWTTELGDLWWSPLYFWSTGIAHDGDHSAGIINVFSTSHGRWISEKVSVTAGTMYNLTGWVMAPWAGGQAYISLIFLDSSDDAIREVRLGPVSAVAEWTELGEDLAAPDEAKSAQVTCILEGQGVVWFDEIGLYLQEEAFCPVMTIRKDDDPDPVALGANLLYQIEYSNIGNRDATGVTIVDTYDDGVTFVEASKRCVSGTDNQWVIGDLPAGMTDTLEITVSVTGDLSDTEAILNSVTISADNVIDCPVSISASATETTHVFAESVVISISIVPDLITKTVDALPATATYYLTATNESTGADLVYFSVKDTAEQVTATVSPTSTRNRLQSLTVTVSLPADLSINQVETIVRAEAEAGGDPALAVQVTYVPHTVYLPIIFKDYPVGWHRAGLQGHEIIALATQVGNSNYLYAGPKHQPELHISSDCGSSWENPVQLAVASNTRSLAVVGTSVWVGTYGGYVNICSGVGHSLTCQLGPQSELTNPYIMALLYDNHNTSIHAGTRDGIFRYPLAGNTWIETLTDQVIVCVIAPGAQPHVFYAGTYGHGIYRSVDGGYSFQWITDSLTETWSIVTDSDGQVCAGTSDGIYCKSTDGSGIWDPAGLQGKTVYALGTDNNRDRLFAGTKSEGVWLKLGGGNWIPLHNGLQPDKVYSLLIQEACGYIFAGTEQGIWRHPLDWE
jgi:uncharacterized repeat protein (TIGR01451 family)